MTTLTYEDLKFPVYVNTRVIGSVGGTQLTVEDAIRAALVSRSNMLLVGSRGTGKTQAAKDILYNFFNGNGLDAEGRPDFKLDELFTRVRLDKLKDAASSEDIIELTSRLTYPVFFIDELNRCPEITQNQFFSLANGELKHKGRPYPLGNKDYSIAVATANLGNGEYTGTFTIDAALLDRFHLILDLDFWRKTPEDEETISLMKRDPRVKQATARDITDKIVDAYKGLGQPSAEMELVQRYLTQGLDYCQTFPAAQHSKRVLAHKWPVICHEKQCPLRDNACGIARPLEERAAQTILRLAQGFEYVAKLKNPNTTPDPVNSVLLAYTLIAPHTKALSQQYIAKEENFGNPSLAGVNAVTKLHEEINNLRAANSPVMNAYAAAKHGKDSSLIDKLDNKFDYLKPFLKRTTTQ